jgi:hypothetical protein
MFWLAPTIEQIGVSTMHVWRSTCGRWRVARVTGPEPRFMVAYQPDGAMERLVANDLPSLARALVAAQPNGDHENDNVQAILLAAEEAGLDRLEPATHGDPKQKERLAQLRASRQATSVSRSSADPTTSRKGTTMSSKKSTKTPKTPKGEKKAPAPKEATKPDAPRKLSALDAAAKVLSEAGQPMSCKEMIDVMAQKGYWTSPGGKTPHATLYAAILREVNAKGDGARFTKTEKGKFTAIQGGN